jgi:uncharacterized membrane protein
MMMTEPSFLLIIYFPHSSIIKKKKHQKSKNKVKVKRKRKETKDKIVKHSLFPSVCFVSFYVDSFLM